MQTISVHLQNEFQDYMANVRNSNVEDLQDILLQLLRKQQMEFIIAFIVQQIEKIRFFSLKNYFYMFHLSQCYDVM